MSTREVLHRGRRIVLVITLASLAGPLTSVDLVEAAGSGTPSVSRTSGEAVQSPGEHSIVARMTLVEPLDLAASERSDLEMAQLTILPGGTTGLQKHTGPALISVLGGTATRHLVHGSSCDSIMVLPGFAYVVGPGDVDEIRNEGVLPLSLQTISLAPAGQSWVTAAAPTAGCGATPAQDVSIGVLTHTSIPGPVHVKAPGPSDIFVGKGVVPPGGRVGWHIHPHPTLVSVEGGRADVMVVAAGRCAQRHYPAGTGFVLPAGELHNDGTDHSQSLTFYWVGISSSDGPAFVLAPPPSECNNGG